MALRHKIDSNETSLFYAEEESLGVLPAVPVWIPLEPNEYDDFGGELTLLARNPINSSRQRKKGVITDLDASGGFQQDFTQTNFQDLLKGFMFANYREKPNAIVTEVTGTGYTVADASAFDDGMLILASGFEDPANNGLKLVTGTSGSPATSVLVAGLVAEASPPADAKIVVVGVQGDTADITVDMSGTYPKIISTEFDFEALGIIAGEWFFVGGDEIINRFDAAENNGFKRVYRVNGNEIEIDNSNEVMTADAGTGKNIYLIFGRVLKNELGALIIRRSYQIERQLGAPDTADLNALQAEYLVGAVANEFTMNIEQADKITADIAFVAIDNEQRTASQGIKAGTRVPLVETDAFNTSSDFSMLKLYIRQPGVYAATPLFAYLTELSLSINNNVTPNKAVAVLGAFDVSVGTFEVSGEATAYFTTIEAVQAVRRNADVGIYVAVSKANAGWVFDIPLLALGDAQNDVSQDEPITLPLSMEAGTAAKLNRETDYTLMWVFFDYLPTWSNPNNV